ncbi:cytochrome b5-like heme/steroid binding domain-containing protein [Lipomyces arxii]|uniref:cytochrome b5-like heme/steroid binding domain-containing protein n=1 Tax=Lipomyces arxii TaxID=56418 RepID=UPI0034D0025D
MIDLQDILTYYKSISSSPSGQTPRYIPLLNALLALLSIYIVYRIIFPATHLSSASRDAERQAQTKPEPIVYTIFTPASLQPFNGLDQERVLMAVKGNVYDVSAGKSFYGPNGPYSNFAGRDASRGLAKGSFDEDMLTPLDHPIDTLDDLSPEEINSLNDWEQHFAGKYLLCGKLVQEL